MPFDRMRRILAEEIEDRDRAGTRKGDERVIAGVLAPDGARGPRVLLQGEGERPFLRMNSNGYLGMARDPEVLAADERATKRFGAGPQAVRFISGTFAPHVELERRIAAFHERDAAMVFSSAYAAVLGILPQLADDGTAVISDALNHNSIINSIRLARPAHVLVYAHLDMAQLERALEEAAASCRRAVIVTDGVFSMRGDHAPLDRIVALAEIFDSRFAENVVVVVDDSHGVGALGASGRGTEEATGARADVLIATLGKAFGVNGGYVAGDETLVDFLRESSPFYVYSNPITPGEAAAASRAIELLDSEEGRARIAHLRAMTKRFRDGVVRAGYETLPGEHPVVPVMVRDPRRTTVLARRLQARGVLATDLHYPVVPRGEDEIRFQICSDHTVRDIDEALAALADDP